MNVSDNHHRRCMPAGIVFSILLSAPLFGQLFADRPDWAGIWGIWGGEDYGGPEWPWYKGTMVHTVWENLEPSRGQWDFSGLDEKLRKAANKGLYLGIAVYHGYGVPSWVYRSGVPEVEASNGKSTPYYLDPDYKPLLFAMINKVAEHVKSLPPEIRNRVIAVQCPAGKSDDPQPYGGDVPAQYEIAWGSGEPWREWNREVFAEYAKAWADMPQVVLIIKPNDILHDYFRQESPFLGRKTWSVAQGYQGNSEMNYEWLRKDLVRFNGNHAMRGRGELDHVIRNGNPWWYEAPVWNMYWHCLWMLTYGVDIFNQRTQALDDPSDYIEAYTFFTDHAGYKSARDARSAWCALRDGLDYLDTQRFPEPAFGPVASGGNKARYGAIAEAMAPYGARQGDPDIVGTALHPYFQDLKALNDVAYDIWPGNYGRFLTQIAANETSQGFWRVGPKTQPYGRFARGFNHGQGKDTLFFDIDDTFFCGNALDGQYDVKIRVVYYDKGTGSWALRYDAVGNPDKTAYTLTKTNTDRWKEKIVTITDGMFSNRGPRKADLSLVNTDGHDDIFHMVEISRETGDRQGCRGDGTPCDDGCGSTAIEPARSAGMAAERQAVTLHRQATRLEIRLPDAAARHIELFDLHGRQVKNLSSLHGRVSIDAVDLPVGLYSVRITPANGAAGSVFSIPAVIR